MRRVALLSVLLLVLGCGGEKEPPAAKPAAAHAWAAEKAPDVESSAESRKAYADAINGFSAKLVKEVLPAPGENLLVSPYSVHLTLTMLLSFATKPTYSEAAKALGYSGSGPNDAVAMQVELLRSEAHEVNIANSLWAMSEGVRNSGAAKILSDQYNAEVHELGPESLDEINGWVNSATDGMVPSILQSLQPDLAALLLNAITFDAAWEEQFNPEYTRTREFWVSEGKSVQAPLMSEDEMQVQFKVGENYRAGRLSYKGGRFNLVLIIPEEAPTTFLKDVKGEAWADWTSGMRKEKLTVALPKSRFSDQHDLMQPLENLGLTTLTRNGALTGGVNSMIQVVQKAVIEFDERGTRAAAVTAVGVDQAAIPRDLICNKPYIFAIEHADSGMILFFGIVNDPTAQP